MEKIVTADTLNKMFDEVKSSHTSNAGNSFELLTNYIITLQEYIADKGEDFKIHVDLLLNYLLSNPEIFPKVNEQLKNLLTTYENTSLDLEKSGISIQDPSSINYNIATCYQRLGDITLAEKYYEKAIAQSPREVPAYYELAALYRNNNQKDKAINVFTEAVSKYNDLPEFYFALGGAYADDERFEDAIASYNKALEFKNYQDRYKVFNDKGVAYLSLNKVEEGINCYKEAMLANPEFPLVYANYGRALALTNKELAEENYKKAIELSPRDIYFYSELATFYENTDQKEKEIDLYTGAISKYSDVPDFYFALGGIYANNGRFEDAITWYSKVLEFKNYGNRYSVLCDKGMAYFSLNKTEEAINCYKEAIQLNPGIPIAYFNYGLALKLSNRDEAITQFKSSIKLDPYYNDPQEELYYALRKKNEFEEIEKFFKELIGSQKKEQGRSYLFLANAQNDLNETDEALANYTEAYKIDKNVLEALFYKAAVLKRLNKTNEALECYEILLKDNPDNYLVYSNYAYFLAGETKNEDAIRIMEKSFKSKDNLANKYYDLGNVYLSGFAYERASQCYDEAIKIDANLVFAQHNKAWIYQKLGNLKSANAEWKKAITLYNKLIHENNTNPDIFFYYAEALFYSVQSENYKKVESLYRDSLQQDDQYTRSYLSLINFYQIKQQISRDNKKEDEATFQSKRNEDRMKMLECYRTGLQIVKNNVARIPTRESLLELGTFYLSMNKYEQAIEYFKKALEKDENFIEGYSALGVSLLKNEQFKEAIANLKASLDLDPDDLNMQSNLGEAYRKAEMYEKAEETFRKILFICPAYIDALVGLAECYKTLGDKAVDEKDRGKAEEYFSNAKDLLDKTLNIPANEVSKRFMDSDKSAIYYSSGYTKVRLFELGGGFNFGLLQSAKRDFDRIQPAQAEYFKAKKAIKKINQKIYDLFSVKKGAPLIIFLISILLFCTMQYLYFFNRYTVKDTFSLNKKELTAFLQKNGLDSLQKKVEVISDQSFSDVEELNDKLDDFIPAAYLNNLKAPVIKKDEIILRENISEVAYGLFSFGALLFMVVGLFLRDITRLKVGSIEMDKNAADNVSVTQSLVSK